MVAVLNPLPSAPRRQPVADRPVLRVISGGRARPLTPPAAFVRPSAAVYRRRRVVALVVAVLVAGVALLAVSSLVNNLSTGTSAAPATSGAVVGDVAAVGATSYVVKSGDTLWAIAHTLRPQGDVRPLVDALAQRVGADGLQVGQRLDLSGLTD